MLEQNGHVPTPEASRFLQRLCYHFSRKISVRYDEQHGEADFPWGRCTLRADAQALHLHCRATDETALAHVRHALDEHIKLFSRKTPMAVQWQPATDAAADTPVAA